MDQANAMMEEIREQSGLLRGLFENRRSLCRDFAALHREKRFKKVYFIGNGSPYYAGCTLCFAAEKLLGADAEAIPSGLFHNHKTFNPSGKYLPEETLLVCPAESGHSKGQVDAARRAKQMGITVMSTTLNPTGVLARTSDVVLAKPGRHEVAIAATKGQTMAIYMILLNFLEAALAAGTISPAQYDEYMEACRRVPDNVDRTIDATLSWFEKNRQRVMDAEKYFLIGYGANFGTVQEAGLKFFECHGKPTVSLELEESLHGPLRGLGKKDVAFFLAVEDGYEKQRMGKNCTYMLHDIASYDAIVCIKAYSSMSLCGLFLVSMMGRQEPDQVLVSRLHQAFDWMEQQKEDIFRQIQAIPYFEKSDAFYMLSRGFGINMMRSASLWVEETAKTMSNVMSIDNFYHGPMEIIRSHAIVKQVTTPVLLDVVTDARSQMIWGKINSAVPDSIYIGAEGKQALGGVCLRYPEFGLEDAYTSLIIALYLQLISYQCAVCKGIEPGTFCDEGWIVQ